MSPGLHATPSDGGLLSAAEARTRFLEEAAAIVGADNVVGSHQEGAYRDPYPLVQGRTPFPGVMPKTTEEVRALVRLANKTGVPLWTISRGKNNGYGGPEARDPHSVILDLHRMDRIIEVNDELGYAVLEPGVTFFALAEYIQENNLKVWPSVPSLGWGSVVGNTLDRGWGYTPMGDHSNQQCGMEVVLPDGDLVRTGMSAITDSPAGPIFKGGYGPGLDGLFFQSNLGIVTQMGIWLLPRPDAFFAGSVITNDESMLPVLIDVLADLRRKDILQNNPVVGNPVRSAANVSPRARWFDGEGVLPPEAIEAIKSDLGIGEWNARFGLYGDREMILRRFEIIKERFRDLPEFTVTGEMFEGADGTVPSDIAEQHRNVQAGHPGYYGLQCVKFRGENGGHIGYVPIIPATGAAVGEFYQESRRIIAEHELDFFAGFHVYPRHVAHTVMIIFNQDSEEDRRRSDLAFRELAAVAKRYGYSEYRAHVDYMDLVAEQYDFNDHALRRTQERIKDALDPNGILSPGKQGVWPERYRA
ncbi:FAD-binding oxidoreductase [Salinibacterium sp. GXW1014]|uniref:FAD-binding oxidoreductase n=1 Tax=Salinibacterium sp. GXW1014 TaxID=3377838 RepID=UPI00383BD4A9